MIEFVTDKKFDFKDIIKVIGVGGGGTNAVNNMYRSGIEQVSFVVCNTDRQSLDNSPVPIKIQLGVSLTEGLGAGNNPTHGMNAAREAQEELREMMDGAKMVFITAGMGGGTGTGAAPVIAQIAKSLNILTVAVVTIPFSFEGEKRIRQAIDGMRQLQQYVDAMIVIDNNKILDLYGDLGISEAFANADSVLLDAVKSIAEIITVPGYINVDFADVQTVLTNSGVAIMGSALGKGKDRALEAAKKSINSPLLNIDNFSGAKKLLVNITHPNKFTTSEMHTIITYLQDELGKNRADIIWGNVKDDNMAQDEVRVTVIATGFNANVIPDVEEILRDKRKDITEKYFDYQDDIKSEQEWETIIMKTIKAQKLQYIENYTEPNIIRKFSEEPAYLRLNMGESFFLKSDN